MCWPSLNVFFKVLFRRQILDFLWDPPSFYPEVFCETSARDREIAQREEDLALLHTPSTLIFVFSSSSLFPATVASQFFLVAFTVLVVAAIYTSRQTSFVGVCGRKKVEESREYVIRHVFPIPNVSSSAFFRHFWAQLAPTFWGRSRSHNIAAITHHCGSVGCQEKRSAKGKHLGIFLGGRQKPSNFRRFSISI